MPDTRRAVQFSAFDALEGYASLIAREKKRQEVRRQLSEDEAQLLSDALAALVPGQTLRLQFWDGDGYTFPEGSVEKVDFTCRLLRLRGRNYPFESIDGLQ